jgi:transcriptional regulator with XRE-family HTH domain
LCRFSRSSCRYPSVKLIIDSKIESGQREISLNSLEKIVRFFRVTLDELVYMDREMPQEVEIEDKTTMEQLQLMQDID